MTTIILNYLILEEDSYNKNFLININTSKNINTLKKTINNDLRSSALIKNLKLFKVNIPLREI